MRTLFTIVICMIAITALALEDTDTPRETKINVTNIEKQMIRVAGEADSDHELVLRVEKTKRTKQLEWTSDLDGTFDAELSSTDKLSLGGGKFGKGIVFKVQHVGGSGGTFNIAMSGRDPVPDGSVRFRPRKSAAKDLPAIKQVGEVLTVADIVCDDGTLIPLTILVRERQITKP